MNKLPDVAKETESPGARGMSCVLFCSDDENGRILCSSEDLRARIRSVGFWACLSLSGESEEQLREALARGGACWVVSPLGVGLISGRYDLWTGTYLYLHVSDHPETLGAAWSKGEIRWPVVTNGSMRSLVKKGQACDTAIYDAFQETLAELRGLEPSDKVKPHVEGVSVAQLNAFIASMARLWGYTASLEAPPHGRALPCHAPLLLEGLLLCYISMAGDMAEDGRVMLRAATIERGGEEVLAVTVEARTDRHRLLSSSHDAHRLLWGWEHLSYKGEVNGVQIHLMVDELPKDEENAPDLCLTTFELIFAKHPAKDPPGAFKTKPELLYDDV